ncbi:hypothetical protein CLV81_3372 [Flagellimonas meridianipacifica]|uniref:Uncharacterized protein n=2 Tax=Flagellimonas meridianipacifica TaxID=1080225 RepID=A0A2T0MBT4_9FLAO|nr:hypothetical protein CLV81_3372 [Allomuricauda pacifica]
MKLDYSQNTQEHRSTVGFHCSFFGRPTESVWEMELAIYKAEYQKIRELLFSNDTGKRYLAVIVCEVLEEQQVFKLTHLEKAHVKGLYDSESEVSFCAGCGFFESYSFRDLLRENTRFGEEARKWAFKKVSRPNSNDNHQKLKQ